MPPPDLVTAVGQSLSFEFDGVLVTNIAVVSGLRLEQSATGSKECSLARALTADTRFERWVESVSADAVRRDGVLVVFDQTGRQIKRYKLLNARPKSLEIATLTTGDTSVLSEKLAVTYERLEIG
jgi:phage tail-like protein